jgi:hypothetical protein
MEEAFTNGLLGRIYIHNHGWKEPAVVQVVGWTKNATKEGVKVRYAYVKLVKFHTIQTDRHGGDGHIDWVSVQSNITQPVRRAGQGIFTLMINDMNGEPDEGIFFLSRGSPSSTIYESYYEVTIEEKRDFRYTWTSPG